VKFQNTILAIPTIIIIIIHVIGADYIERKFFTNEIISLIGLAFLVNNPKFNRRDLITPIVIAFIVLNLIIFLFSLFINDSLYYLLRNSVIFYSTFSYFVGYRILESFESINKLFKRQISIVFVSTLILSTKKSLVSLIDRFSGSTFIASLFSYQNLLSYILMLILLSVFAIKHESSTSIMFIAAIFLMLTLKKYSYFKLLFGIYFISIIFFVFFFHSNITLIEEGFDPTNNEESIYRVINSHWLLSIDPNTTWRLVLWWDVIVNNFPQNIIGIGFGTPMFNYYPVADYSKIKDLPYLMSAHNTFVTIFGRVGILGLILLLLIILNVFKDFFKNKLYYLKHNRTYLFYMLLSLVVIGMFNVLLESPLYASLFWVVSGLCSRAIIIRKKSNESIINS
jgi:O-antigen ligase